MKKAIKRILVLLFAAVFVSLLLPEFKTSDFFNGTIFNVSGIMFSLGLGLVATFNLNSVKNKSYIVDIRKNLNEVRNWFIFYFGITVLCYILNNSLRDMGVNSLHIANIKNLQVKLNLTVLFCTSIFYSIVYYIINFLSIQKLNNDILDKVLKEEEESHE